MFIHFGLYAIPAGLWHGKAPARKGYAEWILYNARGPEIPLKEYQDFAKSFCPVRFDADEWAENAANAGMKYMILTAKHHDGFALWNSRVSDFNLVKATPFKRDLVRELKEACDRKKIAFGVYYSHWQDWEDPDGGLPHWTEITPRPNDRFDRYWKRKCLPQVRELLDMGIRLFWFDNWCGTPNLRHDNLLELMDLVHSAGPDALVNSRIGVTWNAPELLEKVDYISMGDNEFPEKNPGKPWETSGTFNHSWGFCSTDYRWKSTDFLLDCLIRNLGRDGNYQLNVGPAADGTFPKACVRRLREVGAWISANADAVYGTKPFPQPFKPDFGFVNSDSSGRNVYAFIVENSCNIPYFFFTDKPCLRATILETGEPVDFYQDNTGIGFQMPVESVFSRFPVVRFEFAEK